MKKKFKTVLLILVSLIVSTIGIIPNVKATDLSSKIVSVNGAPGTTEFTYSYDDENDITNVNAAITLTEQYISSVLEQAPGNAGEKASLGTYYFTMTPTLDGNPTHFNYTNKNFLNDTDIATAKAEVNTMLDVELGWTPTSPTVWPINIIIQYYDGEWKSINDQSNGGITIKSNLLSKLGLTNDSDLVYGENYRFYMNTERYWIYAFDGYERGWTDLVDKPTDNVSTREFVKVTYEVKFPVTAHIDEKGVYYTNLTDAVASGSQNIEINEDLIVDRDTTIPNGTTVTVATGKTVTIVDDIEFVNDGIIINNGTVIQDGKTFHNIETSATNGTITLTNQFVKAGEVVTFTLDPEEGYELESVEVTGASETEIELTENGNEFVMPAEDVTITVNFKEIVIPPTLYTLQIITPENGTLTASGDEFEAGVEVSVQAVPAIGYELVNITYTHSGGSFEVENNKFIMPAGDVEVSARFREIIVPPTLFKVNTVAQNGTITLSKTEFKAGDEVSFTITPNVGYTLASVQVTAANGVVLVTNNKFVMPNGNVTITATFEKEVQPTLYKVNTVAQNGTITLSKTEFKAGDEVSFTVVPNDGYRLVSIKATDVNNEIVITNNKFAMPAKDVTITAIFEKIPLIEAIEDAADDIVLDIPANNSLSKDIFEAIKDSGVNVTFESTTKTDGKPLFTWTFNGSEMNDGTDFELDLSITIGTSTNQDEILSLVEDAKESLIIEFSHHGDLPNGTVVSIYVGDTFADGTTLSLHYYNNDNDVLEAVAEDIVVKDGYATFSLEHCSEYVLTTVNTNVNNPQTGVANLTLNIMLCLVSAAGMIILISKRKKEIA